MKGGKTMENNVEQKTIEKTTESIEKILNDGLNTNNIDNLYKLSKIKHMAKEDESMNYGNYGNYGGRRAGYDAYGRDEYGRGGYGARGRDMRYRGHDHLDRIYDDYGRYMESRERYGASDETDKSYHYMIKALEDFIMVLHEEADTPQQKQMLNETLQRSMR